MTAAIGIMLLVIATTGIVLLGSTIVNCYLFIRLRHVCGKYRELESECRRLERENTRLLKLTDTRVL